jgi:hypothetical protein
MSSTISLNSTTNITKYYLFPRVNPQSTSLYSKEGQSVLERFKKCREIMLLPAPSTMKLAAWKGKILNN